MVHFFRCKIFKLFRNVGETELELVGCIPPRHQLLRDVIHYATDTARVFPPIVLGTPQEFRPSADHTHNGSTLSRQSAQALATQQPVDALSKLSKLAHDPLKNSKPSLAPWDKHRLGDVTLQREYERQEKLRSVCEQRTLRLSRVFEQWDRDFGVWLRRDPDVGYGERDVI